MFGLKSLPSLLSSVYSVRISGTCSNSAQSYQTCGPMVTVGNIFIVNNIMSTAVYLWKLCLHIYGVCLVLSVLR